jgi:hypothetical protein
VLGLASEPYRALMSDVKVAPKKTKMKKHRTPHAKAACGAPGRAYSGVKVSPKNDDDDSYPETHPQSTWVGHPNTSLVGKISTGGDENWEIGLASRKVRT